MSWFRALVAAFLLARASAAPASPPSVPAAGRVRGAVEAHLASHGESVVRELMDLLALPNLASDAEGIRANADHVVRLLERRHVQARRLEVADGPPAVYGEIRAPGATRTLLIYAHYDGQPVHPADWATPPWTPTLRDGTLEDGGKEVTLGSRPLAGEWRLYGRSASDDKAPIVGVLAALDALAAAKIPLSVNLKLLFEGEEEAGSPHLAALLGAHSSLLTADVWLLCDGPVHQTRRMQVFFGARGVTDVEITAYGPVRPLHSGHYGNWVPNPAAVLANVVAGMRDGDGQIRIAGFYDDVRPLTAGERRAVDALPPVEDELQRAFGIGGTEAGDARLADRILLPALNVRGLESGKVGREAANAIPTRAQASIDFRLVPDQTPDGVRRRVEAHLTAQGFHLVHEEPDLETRRAHPRLLKLEWGSGYPSSRTDLDQPAARAVVAVIGEALAAPPVVVPSLGGSIPMYLFSSLHHEPIVGVPIANHDNNQHAANENLRLQNLWDGIQVYAGLLARLGPALH